MKILNLTQHVATDEQIAQGVFDGISPEALKAGLNFDKIPTNAGIQQKAEFLTQLAMQVEATHVMIGGAPYLMAALERTLKAVDIVPLYAFSERVSEEKTMPDGSVVKTNVFKHVGFVGL